MRALELKCLADNCRPPSRTTEPESKPVISKPSSAEVAPTIHSAQAAKIESGSREVSSKPGSSYPAIKTSDIDVDARPVFESAGKSIMELDMDTGKSSLVLW